MHLPLPLPVDVSLTWVELVGLVVGFLAAGGTLAAVAVAIVDAKRANARADRAEARTREVYETQDQIRRDNFALELARAHGIVDIYITVEWANIPPAPPPGYEVAEARLIVMSNEEIRDVEAFLHPSLALTPKQPQNRFEESHRRVLGQAEFAETAKWAGNIPVPDGRRQRQPTGYIRFTDSLENRWELHSDRSLYLLNPRTIREKPRVPVA